MQFVQKLKVIFGKTQFDLLKTFYPFLEVGECKASSKIDKGKSRKILPGDD